MKANPKNWENCALYVQDIVSPGLNVAAEISRQEITNFKLMCQLFSSYEPPKLNIEKPVDITSDQHIFTLINGEIGDMLHHINSGLDHESEIISSLTKYFHEINPSLKIVPFGSRRYIKRSKTNFNLWIDTGVLVIYIQLIFFIHSKRILIFQQTAEIPKMLVNVFFINSKKPTSIFISKIYTKLMLIAFSADNLV